MPQPRPSSSNPPPLTEAQIFDRLCAGEAKIDPLDVRWTRSSSTRGRGSDATAEIPWEGSTLVFAVEIKARSTPKAFAEGVAQVRAYATANGLNPLLVMPYLSTEQLADLRQASVSGIDLCGNALITVPGKIFVYVNGAPNRFPASSPIRNVYAGATSLVARALLLRPNTSSLNDLAEFVRSRGGSLTLTTISKALRRMEDDVLIERRGGSARVLQADALLDKLRGGFRWPKIARMFVGQTSLSPRDIAERLNATGMPWTVTGQSSTERYAVMPREKVLRVYCTSLPSAVSALGTNTTETDRFPDVEFRETDDPTVAFDARIELGMRFASPVQTYLELMQGDKREQEVATQVRELILAETRRLLGAA